MLSVHDQIKAFSVAINWHFQILITIISVRIRRMVQILIISWYIHNFDKRNNSEIFTQRTTFCNKHFSKFAEMRDGKPKMKIILLSEIQKIFTMYIVNK